MKHFLVISNRTKDKDGLIAGKVQAYLTAHGADCVIARGIGVRGEHYTDASRVAADTDCVIVLGGDGTLLRAANDLADIQIPFVGINLGTLGFLSEINVNEIEEALSHLIAGHYAVENRMMLLGESYVGEDKKDSSFALNDIVITRSGSLRIIDFNIYVNGSLLHRYHADGMIAATPTGSTGYSLSAGGPIVNPSAELILLSPICPHSMHNRSIVLSAEDQVMIEIDQTGDGSLQEAEVIYDGSHKITLHTGDRVIISKSQKTTGIVKLRKESFLEILHQKLSD